MAFDRTEPRRDLPDHEGARRDPDDLESEDAEALDAPVVADDGLETEFRAALDLNSWTSGERLDRLAERLEYEVQRAAAHEDGMAPRVLKAVEEALKTAPDRSEESGVYALTPDHVVDAINNVLFNGNVEACDGTRIVVETLPVTVMQIGICLTSYQGTGDGGTIGHRLFRHDVMRRNGDATDEVRDFLARRANRRSREAARREFGEDGQCVDISDMLCRAIMIYAERAMLLERSDRPWEIRAWRPDAARNDSWFRPQRARLRKPRDAPQATPRAQEVHLCS